MTRRLSPCVLALLAVFALATLPVFAADSPSGSKDLSPQPHAFPKVGQYEVLVGDFHMHTLNSDGRPTTRQRVEESYRLGYDVIAITDHGRTRAYRIAKYVGQQLGMVVLTGVETGVASKEHMNAIGFSTDYQPRNPHRWSETPGGDTVYYRDEMKAIAAHGGFLIYNHPHVGFREPVEWGIKEGIIQGIEVENDVVGDKWNTIEWNGRYCYPNAFDYALKNDLTIFANTDVHGNRNSTPARTLILSNARTPEAVMDALRARRTAAWFEGVVWGREDLLADLMQASVKLSRSPDGIRVENLSPLTLQAVVSGSKVEIGPYQQASVKAALSGDKVSIKWDNIWTSPTTNLTTTHSLRHD